MFLPRTYLMNFHSSNISWSILVTMTALAQRWLQFQQRQNNSSIFCCYTVYHHPVCHDLRKNVKKLKFTFNCWIWTDVYLTIGLQNQWKYIAHTLILGLLFIHRIRLALFGLKLKVAHQFIQFHWNSIISLEYSHATMHFVFGLCLIDCVDFRRIR